MLRVIRFFKAVSMCLFIASLGVVYYEITNDSKMVMLYSDTQGRALFRIEPALFFYASAGFFILLNLLISAAVQLVGKYPLSKLALPQRDFWLKDADSRDNLREVLQSWVHFLAIILNCFLVFLMIKIWLINRSQGGKPIEYLAYILALFALLTIWVGFIFYRLRLRKVEFIG